MRPEIARSARAGLLVRPLLIAALVAVLAVPDALGSDARLSEDRTTLFLQEEVRGPGARRPGVALNVEPDGGRRQIWVSGDGLPILPTVDVLCGSRKRTLALTRSQTAHELQVGLYEVPRDLAETMLNSTDCRLALTGDAIPIPRDLLWSVWAEAAHGTTAPRILEGRVTWVIDGDTIRVAVGDHAETVRYIGINAPEVGNPPQPWEQAGRDARDVNVLLVGQKKVRLELDVEERDAYGRLLAYVYVGDTLVNAEMVRRGYATTQTVPPNVKHEALLARLEREARERNQGLWDVARTETPSAAPPAAAPTPAAARAPAAAPQPSAAPAAARPAAKSGAPSAFECPAALPIKGNLTTRGECLYFLPGKSTGKKADFCFATEQEAVQGGCVPAR